MNTNVSGMMTRRGYACTYIHIIARTHRLDAASKGEAASLSARLGANVAPKESYFPYGQAADFDAYHTLAAELRSKRVQPVLQVSEQLCACACA